MRKQKPIDLRIVSELLRNSRISDRQLAKKLGVSQPTVSRRRFSLEKGMFDGYTIVPKWDALGYELLAITLIKTKPVFSSKEKYNDVNKRGFGWLGNQPNVLLGGAIEGMGFNSFMISVHKSYSDYNEFLHKLRLDMGDLIDDVQTLLVDLVAENRLKPLGFKYLAEANK